MAAPSYVYTIGRVARMLGQDETLLEDIALLNMDPEDGCLTILDLDDDVSTTAFTPFGIENLKELLADLKSHKTPSRSDPSRARSPPRCSADGYS